MQELAAPEDTHARALADLPATLASGVVGLAVSGGSDSLALALLTAAWARRTGVRLIVLTVDHGLRPESGEEAERVAARMGELGLEHLTLRWTSPRAGAARARAARHALLARALTDAGGRLLLTGHTADDQDETFLIRARQGSGWYGLAGMRGVSVSPAPEGEGTWVARPLLATRREDLRDWLRARSETWSDDPGNEDMRSERVRMRRLLAADPALRARAGRIRAVFGALRGAEDAALARWLSEHVSAASGGGLTASFAGLPEERAGRALGLLIGLVTGRRTPVRTASLRPLAARLVRSEGFRGATLGGARLRNEGKTVSITREDGPKDQPDEARDLSLRLARLRALLSGGGQDFAPAAGKESFLQLSKPILSAEILS